MMIGSSLRLSVLGSSCPSHLLVSLSSDIPPDSVPPLDLTHYGTIERNPGMAAYRPQEWDLIDRDRAWCERTVQNWLKSDSFRAENMAPPGVTDPTFVTHSCG
jgi:hypothetical protein